MPAEARRDSTYLRVLSVILSGLYLATIPLQPLSGRALIKASAIALLGVLAWQVRLRLLTLALVLSAAGDYLLDVDPAALFVPGLSAFLLAHVVYSILFLRRRTRWSAIRLPRILVMFLAVAYATAFTFRIWPELHSLAVPVALYICIITGMVESSLVSTYAILVPVGALLFLSSDSLLAIGKFKGPFPLRDYTVWATYYAAQYAIVSGILNTRFTTDDVASRNNRAASATSPR